MTAASPTEIDIQNGLATICLDRAGRGNALSADLVAALREAVDRACADASVHTLALVSTGRHFCTGFDLSDLDSESEGDLLLRFVQVEMLLAALWHAPVRTVAVATGRAWGAGADLFAACDYRIAAEDASFRFPGARFGLVLGTRRLAERVGTDRCRAWVSEGTEIDTKLALASGLASHRLASSAVPASDQASPWRSQLPPLAVDRCTNQQLRQASRADRVDADLANLVRSAAVPGLKDRIVAYRNSARPVQVPRA